MDKTLVHLGVGSRSEVQKLVRQGRVLFQDQLVRDPALQIIAEGAVFRIDDREIIYTEFTYYMLNKPAGLISASRGEDIVLELLAADDLRLGLFPVGRLDKDTEGLLLICNDGPLAHRLLAPKQHVPKRYLVEVEGMLDLEAVASFQRGVVLEDGDICLPAELLLPEEHIVNGCVEVVLHEGKFHQVKRMMQSVGCRVTYLKRIAFGPLELDDSLAPGAYRTLKEEEIAALQSATISHSILSDLQ